MSNDEPIIRPNLMHLGGAGGGRGMGHGMGHGGGGCGCGGQGGGCGGGGRASRDFVTLEPDAEKVTQPEAVA